MHGQLLKTKQNNNNEKWFLLSFLILNAIRGYSRDMKVESELNPYLYVLIDITAWTLMHAVLKKSLFWPLFTHQIFVKGI